MADSICRALRDGALDGEHSPSLTLKDSIHSPYGLAIFDHLLTQLYSNISSRRSQSRGLVIVALSRSPAFYSNLVKSKGNEAVSSYKWIRVLDCYTDPLGWKERLVERGSVANSCSDGTGFVDLCKDVKDLDKVFLSILELGKGFVVESKDRFSVAIDSVSEMLRHTSISSVAGMLSNLRSNNLVSSMFWLLHSDLHETKVSAALEYMSSMVADIEPIVRLTDIRKDNLRSLSLLEHNYSRAKFHVRTKRRNGRVRVLCEEFYVDESGVKFRPVSSEDAMITQNLVPKVQFNLQLSEKELNDRANVVLPFEHQDDGKSTKIYDGRRTLDETKFDSRPSAMEKTEPNGNSGRGEIIYFRDSDDEMPDSDEDPDNDLDI